MLYRTFRPRSWQDFIGNPKAIATVRRIIGRPGFDRGAFWIDAAGQHNSGIGKTSLALLIAESLADPFYITEIDGSRCDKAAVGAMLQAAYLKTPHVDKPYRVWVVNEAHAMTSGAVDAFLTFLEALPPHTVVVFTTTRKADENLFGDHDSGPFASRCHCITLTNQGLAQSFARRAQEIAKSEGLDGQPIGAYVRLVQSCRNNFRAVLQQIEAGAMLTEGA
ncbi:MAG: AAA family ATPase [Phycisphaerae bacterium]